MVEHITPNYKTAVRFGHSLFYIIFYHVGLLGFRCSQEWVAPLLRELGSSPKHGFISSNGIFYGHVDRWLQLYLI